MTLKLTDGWTPARCPQCEREAADARERQERERRERDAAEQARRNFERSGVPDRFRESDFGTYAAEGESQRRALLHCSDYAARFPEHLARGTSLILCGSTGTGKTHLACAIARQVAHRHGRSVAYTTAAKAFREVKDTFRRDSSETEGAAIRSLTRPALLVIDEVGVQFGTDAERNILFEIVNDRYGAVLPTVLVSNLAARELAEFAGERVIDRMRENGGAMVTFNWGSHRGAKP